MGYRHHKRTIVPQSHMRGVWAGRRFRGGKPLDRCRKAIHSPHKDLPTRKARVKAMADSEYKVREVEDHELDPNNGYGDDDVFSNRMKRRLRQMEEALYVPVEINSVTKEALLYKGRNGQYFMRLNTDCEDKWDNEPRYALGKLSQEEAIQVTKAYIKMFQEELD